MTLDTPLTSPAESPSTTKTRKPAKRAALRAGPSKSKRAIVVPPSPKAGSAAPIGPPAEDDGVLAPIRAAAEGFDREVRAAMGRATGSLSVASVLLAGIDWAVNLMVSPGKQAELQLSALSKADALADYGAKRLLVGPALAPRCVTPPAHDRRFDDPAWLHWPFDLLHQAFLLNEQWWAEATHGVAGVEHHHEDVVSFVGRQLLDMYSPGNNLWTNPVALRRTLDESGLNLLRGAYNAIDDAMHASQKLPPPGAENFIVGRDVAITPGRVVFKNRLIELIQYSPATPQVCPEPVLLVPAWIMKYYILDLSPANSLIKYLVDQGHTVFCISWKNPTPQDRDLGMDDYVQLGLFAALEAVSGIMPQRKVHALGYCLGGTLLSIGAAAMARDHDDRLGSITLLAAQTDFTEPGELALFIDEAQMKLLEAQMADAGYLTAQQMAGAFTMLRPNDLLWSRIINRYFMGEPEEMNDLMAWNADATRLPARMHTQYLERLFLHNDLAQCRYRFGDRPVALTDVRVPIFLVGTVTDHVAPWRSVYKLHHLTPAEITFVLTSGGHNAGIVSPPGRPHRHYQLLKSGASEQRLDSDTWLATAPDNQGSWWPAWHEWLSVHSGAPVVPPSIGMPGAHATAAPGHYVTEK